MNRRYALRDDNQAIAYLCAETIHGVNLRQNYILILQEIRRRLETGKTTLSMLLGPLDASKAISSFRLFERIGRHLRDMKVYKLCERVLELVENPRRRPKQRFFRIQSL